MRAKFICPGCEQTVLAPTAIEGSSSPCAKCGLMVAKWPPPLPEAPPEPSEEATPLPRRREPLELDDDESPRRRSRRESASKVSHWQALKWCSYFAGVFCALKAFEVSAIHAGPWAGIACFCAITSRLAQVEEYHTPNR